MVTAGAERLWPILAVFAPLASQANDATGGGLGTLTPFHSWTN
jgi:hypothetical protein